MSTTTTVPTPQAITAWKNKGDKIVALSADLDAAQAKLEKKLKPIREAHEPEIEKLKNELRKLTADFHDFGVEHGEVIFADGSEIRTKVSVITGKLNPPSVCLNEGVCEADAVEALDADKETRGFVAVKKSLDKAGLKKALATASGKLAEKLEAAGIYLGQGFSVSVKSKGD